MSNKWSAPKEVSDADKAFGRIDGLMPSRSEIPKDYPNRRQWTSWQGDWFFTGLKCKPTPKDGIDVTKAMRHLACIQGSFQPKREDREAAVAYLASLWFADTGKVTA